jgi:hypothetical protein
MATNELPRFIFRGNAMPFGARITKTNEKRSLDLVTSPPTAALTVVGGLSSARGGPAKPHPAFNWEATFAEARGEELRNRGYRTTVTSEIKTLWVRNDPHVFEVDVLRIKLVSDHAPVQRASIKIEEALFGGTETVSPGMRLDREQITVQKNEDLNQCPTMEAFDDKFQSDPKFFKRHQHPHRKYKVSFGDPIPRVFDGYAITSIVDSFTWRGTRYEGHVLTLEGFGTLYFGEVLMNEHNRRLTMVRLEMGSELGAEVACAEGDPNGTWGR